MEPISNTLITQYGAIGLLAAIGLGTAYYMFRYQREFIANVLKEKDERIRSVEDQNKLVLMKMEDNQGKMLEALIQAERTMSEANKVISDNTETIKGIQTFMSAHIIPPTKTRATLNR